MTEKYISVTRLKLTLLNMRDADEMRGNKLGVCYFDLFIRIVDRMTEEVENDDK